MRSSIFQIDCIQGMRVFPDQSFDIVICDPPYNIGKSFGNNNDNLALPEYIDWCGGWISESLRLMKSTATMFVYGFPEILAHLCKYFDQYRILQWHYTNKNTPHLDFWQRSHESILCIWKENKIFNKDAVREPYTENFLKNAKGKTRKGSKCRFGETETVYNAHENGALPRDVFEIPALAGGAGLAERFIFCKTCNQLLIGKEKQNHSEHDLIIHPTQKPFALTVKLIKSCKPEDKFNVLIPFCGSGSECLCVKKEGGNFTAFEINPDYIILANNLLTLA